MSDRPSQRPRWRVGPIALLIAALLIAGCGYSWVGVSPEGQGERLRIDLFENQTYETLASEIVTQVFRVVVTRRGDFRLVDASQEAEGLFLGSVNAMDWGPVAFDADGRARRWRLSLSLTVEWRDSFDHVWARVERSRALEYPASETELAAPLADESARAQAIERLAGIMAEGMVMDLLRIRERPTQPAAETKPNGLPQ